MGEGRGGIVVVAVFLLRLVIVVVIVFVVVIRRRRLLLLCLFRRLIVVILLVVASGSGRLLNERSFLIILIVRIHSEDEKMQRGIKAVNENPDDKKQNTADIHANKYAPIGPFVSLILAVVAVAVIFPIKIFLDHFKPSII